MKGLLLKTSSLEFYQNPRTGFLRESSYITIQCGFKTEFSDEWKPSVWSVSALSLKWFMVHMERSNYGVMLTGVYDGSARLKVGFALQI